MTGFRRGGTLATETTAHAASTHADDRLEESRVPHDPERRRQSILDSGGGSEPAGEDEADRGGEHEAGVLPGEDDSRRRERVQAEEARTDREREADQEQPSRPAGVERSR